MPCGGVSSGGKYAASCAWKIHYRLTAAVIMSANCPYDLPGAKEPLSNQDRQMYVLAEKIPWLFRLVFGKYARDMLKNPVMTLSYFNESVPDKMTAARPDVKQVFELMPAKAFRQGVRAVALDLTLEARPWGFALHEIYATFKLCLNQAQTWPFGNLAKHRILTSLPINTCALLLRTLVRIRTQLVRTAKLA